MVVLLFVVMGLIEVYHLWRRVSRGGTKNRQKKSASLDALFKTA